MEKEINQIVKDSQFLGHPVPGMDAKALRQFGLMFAAIFVVLFGLLLPFIFGFAMPLWPWIVGGVFLLAAAVPVVLSPFYALWMRFGIIMNMIMSRIILGSVFVLTVIPTGVIMRLRGKDILNLKIDNETSSYRVKSAKDSSNNLKKPY